LNAFKIELQDLSDRADEGRLAKTGESFEQDVTLAENADQHQTVKLLASEQNAVELLKRLPGKFRRWTQLIRFQYQVGISHGE
jgi:hypothetical protein